MHHIDSRLARKSTVPVVTRTHAFDLFVSRLLVDGTDALDLLDPPHITDLLHATPKAGHHWELQDYSALR